MEAQKVSRALVDGAASVIRGKTVFLEFLVAAILAEGHVLLDDLPGLGKTTVAKTFSRLIGDEKGKALSFKRIQFTPDLLPYDITGVDVFDPEKKGFRFIKGPIFANIVLADEINRSTPKVQSALLEVMAEGQVTVGTTTRTPPSPFIVLATQNPVESEGTFPLPAAQLDRFMMRLSLGYPDRETELSLLEDNPAESSLMKLKPLVKIDAFLKARQVVSGLFCHPGLKEAVADIVRESRVHKHVSLGASPRAAIHLMRAVKALAFVKGRDYVIDEDILLAAPAVLAHRLKLRDPRIEPEILIRELALERLKRLGQN